MVLVECLYTGSYVPGKKSIQQQQKESRIFAKMLGWKIKKEYIETEDDMQFPMPCRKAIQEIIADAKAKTFQVLIAWGVHCLSEDEEERLAFLQRLEREGITLLLIGMDGLAQTMGDPLLEAHNAPLEPVPEPYYKQFKKKYLRWGYKELGTAHAATASVARNKRQ